METMTLVHKNESALAALARWGVPWLLSFCTHLALFLALALSFQASTGWFGGRQGMPGKHQFLETSFGDGGDGFAAIGLNLGPPSGGYFADDDPPQKNASVGGTPLVGETVAGEQEIGAATNAAATGAAGGGVQLATVLQEGPGVDLAGVLPASSPMLGAGGLEGGEVGQARGSSSAVRGGTGYRGGYARTGVFGVQGEGHKFVYVFDRSGSMDGHGGAPLAAAKQQLMASLDDLGDTHQFQIIFYNEHPRVFTPTGVPGRLVWGNDANKMSAKRFVQSITADGATEHEEALSLALRMAPDVIFFLTDADEPRLTADQMSRLERLNRGSSINTIEFGYGPSLEPNNFLVQLARRNGGKHVYVDVARLPRVR